MASGRAADWEDPSDSKRIVVRNIDRDPIRELHQGQRSCASAPTDPMRTSGVQFRMFAGEHSLEEPGHGTDV